MRNKLLPATIPFLTMSLVTSKAAAQSCTYEVTPTSISATAASKSGILAVTASSETCTWMASSDAAWTTLGAVSSGYAGRVLSDHPVGYWRLNEATGTAVADVSGHRLDGIRRGGVTLQAGGALSDGDNAMILDGDTGGIDIAPNSRFGLTSGVTMESWIKTTGTGTWQRIIGAGTNDPSPWQLRITSGGLLVFGTRTTTGYTELWGSAVVTDGAWHHVVATWDGVWLRLYLDGVAHGSTYSEGTLLPTTAKRLWIGAAPDYPMTVGGTLDEVALYDYALTGEQVAAHFGARTSSGAGGSGAVTYSIAANTATTPRTAALTVAGATIAVAQDAFVAPTCSFSITPTSINAGAAGGAGVASVVANDPSCAWSTSSNAAWVTPGSTAFGYSGAVLVGAPVAYWRLNDNTGTTIADRTGHGFDGTRNSGVAFSSAGALADGDGAMSFNGSGTIDVPASSGLDTPTGLTVEAWIKTAGTGTWQWIAGMGPNATARWSLRLLSSGIPYFTVKTNIGTQYASGFGWTSVTDNQWRHVVATWDGTTARLYVDGAEDGIQPLTGTLQTGDGYGLSIGSVADYPMWVEGMIDDVAIYNFALSETQVAAHYALRSASGSSGSGAAPYSIAANNSATSRSATMTIGAQQVTVSQSGIPSVTITLTAPFPGTTYTNPSSVTLTASASVANGSISRVDFFAGASLIGTSSTTPYQSSWTSIAPGTYALTAIATDNTGHTTTSPVVNVTVSSGGSTFGTLGTPIASPAAGVFGPNQSVTLRAADGTTIRYTTDGSTPTTSSPLYSTAIVVTSSTTVKAQAFQDGWTSSAALTSVYTIDSLAPTVTAKLTPPANLAGWNSTPVTVTFVCSDDLSGVGSCPARVTFDNEGANQSVTVTASDLVGNQRNATITVNIDTTRPQVLVSSPPADLVIPGTEVTVNGSLTDTLSGLSSATCNGVAASISGATYSCTVPLGLGINDVTVHALDIAGNGNSAAVRVLRATNATSISITPATRTLVIGELLPVVVTDEFGQIITNAALTIDAAAVAHFLPEAPDVISADSAGPATITATWQGLTATLALNVLSTPTYTSGTLRWSMPVPSSKRVVTWIHTQATSFGDPSMFMIEGPVGSPFGPGLRIHALADEGERLWVSGAPLSSSEFMIQAAGDRLGAGILMIAWNNSNPNTSSIVRFAARPGTSAWRYTTNGQILAMAQALDGTVFAYEENASGFYSGVVSNYFSRLAVIDGATGALRSRVELALPTTTTIYGNYYSSPHSDIAPNTPRYSVPIVLENGHCRFEVSWEQKVEFANPFGAYSPTNPATSASYSGRIYLYDVAADGSYSVFTLESYDRVEDASQRLTGYGTLQNPSYTGALGSVRPVSVLPDASGGVFALYDAQAPGESAGMHFRIAHAVQGSVSTYERPAFFWPALLGDDNRAYGWNDSTQYGQGAQRWPAAANRQPVAVNLSNGTQLWTSSVLGVPVAAGSDGSMILNSGGTLRRLDVNGQPGEFASASGTSTPTYRDLGVRHTWYQADSSTLLAYAGLTLVDATNSFLTETTVNGGIPQRTAGSPTAPVNATSTIEEICFKDFRPPAGHGVSADGRRIITLKIDSSWNVPGSSPPLTEPRIWNAVQLAIDMWNSQDDASPPPGPYKTPYYLQVDQAGSLGMPDITITKENCPSGSGSLGFACTELPNNDTSLPATMRLSSINVTTPTVRDEDLRGRVAHEIGHKFGGKHFGACGNCIMHGSYKVPFGTRPYNQVIFHDVRMANQAFSRPQLCQGLATDVQGWSEEGSAGLHNTVVQQVVAGDLWARPLNIEYGSLAIPVLRGRRLTPAALAR